MTPDQIIQFSHELKVLLQKHGIAYIRGNYDGEIEAGDAYANILFSFEELEA